MFDHMIRRLAEQRRMAIRERLSVHAALPARMPGRKAATDNDGRSLILFYNLRIGQWSGDDSPSDANGYGHASGEEDGDGGDQDDCAIWFDITQNDKDGDGLTWWQEVQEYGTDPTEWDTDGDGAPDGSDFYPLNPNIGNMYSLLDFSIQKYSHGGENILWAGDSMWESSASVSLLNNEIELYSNAWGAAWTYTPPPSQIPGDPPPEPITYFIGGRSWASAGMGELFTFSEPCLIKIEADYTLNGMALNNMGDLIFSGCVEIYHGDSLYTNFEFLNITKDSSQPINVEWNSIQFQQDTRNFDIIGGEYTIWIKFKCYSSAIDWDNFATIDFSNEEGNQNSIMVNAINIMLVRLL